MTTRPPHTFHPNGLCLAMLHDLPDGTEVRLATRATTSGLAGAFITVYFADRPVIVTRWDDGTEPVKPEPADPTAPVPVDPDPCDCEWCRTRDAEWWAAQQAKENKR